MKAYDMSVVERNGEGTNASEINFPENLPQYLLSCEEEKKTSSVDDALGDELPELVDDLDSPHELADQKLPPEMDLKIAASVKGEEVKTKIAQNERSDAININVQFPDGMFGEVEVPVSNTINALKMKIEKEYGRTNVTNKMTFEGQELEGKKLLSDYNIIQDESIVKMQLQVYIGFPNRPGFLLDVSAH